MASIYRVWITDFGSLKQEINRKDDSVLLPVFPRIGDIILYFYPLDPKEDETEEIELEVTSVNIYCQPDLDNHNIKPGQESKFWDDAFTYHAKITVDKVRSPN